MWRNWMLVPALILVLTLSACGGTASSTEEAAQGELSESRVEAQQVSDGEYSVNVTVDLLDRDGVTITGLESWSFPYVYTGERWVFTDFHLIY